MKTTNSKDLIKVNQILTFMQEYFGKSMNLARIQRFIANYALNLDLMIVMTGGSMAYTRPDGVKVIPLACLKD